MSTFGDGTLKEALLQAIENESWGWRSNGVTTSKEFTTALLEVVAYIIAHYMFGEWAWFQDNESLAGKVRDLFEKFEDGKLTVPQMLEAVEALVRT